MTIFSKQNVDLITFNFISEKKFISSFGIALNQKGAFRKVCSCYHKILPEKKTLWSFIKNRTKSFISFRNFSQSLCIILTCDPVMWLHQEVSALLTAVLLSVPKSDLWGHWDNGRIKSYHRKKKELIHIYQGRKRIYGALVVAAGRCSITQEKLSTSLITFD